jgi:hypothetical protein
MTEKKLNTEQLERYLTILKGMRFEEDHQNADDILCEILTTLGYQEIVEAYNNVPKWFD